MASEKVKRFKSKWLCACAPAVGLDCVKKYFPLIKYFSFDAILTAADGAASVPTGNGYLRVLVNGQTAATTTSASTPFKIRAFDTVEVVRSGAWENSIISAARWTMRFAFDGGGKGAPLTVSGSITSESEARFPAPLADGYYYHTRFARAAGADLSLRGVSTYPPCIIE